MNTDGRNMEQVYGRQLVSMRTVIEALKRTGGNDEQIKCIIETVIALRKTAYATDQNRFTFGKYNGRSVAEIFKENNRYCQWLVAQPFLRVDHEGTYHTLVRMFQELNSVTGQGS